MPAIISHVLQLFLSANLILLTTAEPSCAFLNSSETKEFTNALQHRLNDSTPSTLDNGTLSNAHPQYITELWLAEKGIERIREEAFNSLQCLIVLDLHGNKIDALSSASLEGLNSLEELNFSNNLLKTFAPFTFSGTKILQILDLSGNKIDALAWKSLSNLFYLRKLNLSHNNLDRIPDESFDHLISLTVLDLSWNRLQEVSPQKWFTLNSLSILDLSNNLLKIFDTDCDFPFKSLRKLYLNGNQLTKLDAVALRDTVPNVMEVSLGANSWPCAELEAIIEVLKNGNISCEVSDVTCSDESTPEFLALSKDIQDSKENPSNIKESHDAGYIPLEAKKLEGHHTVEVQILQLVQQMLFIVVAILVIVCICVIPSICAFWYLKWRSSSNTRQFSILSEP